MIICTIEHLIQALQQPVIAISTILTIGQKHCVDDLSLIIFRTN